MAKYNGVKYLAMATGDMDTTIRFWRDLLGMRMVAGLGQPGFRHYFFQISDNDLTNSHLRMARRRVNAKESSW